MHLNLNEEQSQIDSSVTDFLNNEYSFQQRKISLESITGIHLRTWSRFAELGWLGLSLSERAGGLGLGLLESGLLMAGLGRHLVIEPVWSSSILASHALQTCAPSRVDLLESLINGQDRAALIFQGVTDIEASESTFVATQTASGYELSGNLQTCPGAPCANYLLVLARLHQTAEQHPALFLVNRDAPGVDLLSYRMLDGARAASVSMDRVKLTSQDLLSDDPGIVSIIENSIARAMLLLCWEAMGSMTAAFEQTCAYVGTRTQFGKTLNEFQVVQHKLAEMAVLCREARAICELGVVQASQRFRDVKDIAIRVKAKVGRCAQIISKDCVQLHGAMGVTEELPIASHFRKMLWFQAIWGQADALDQISGMRRLLSGDAFNSAVLPALPAIEAIPA